MIDDQLNAEFGGSTSVGSAALHNPSNNVATSNTASQLPSNEIGILPDIFMILRVLGTNQANEKYFESSNLLVISKLLDDSNNSSVSVNDFILRQVFRTINGWTTPKLCGDIKSRQKLKSASR